MLYGTTQQGGISDYGAVFKVNTDGTGYTTLLQFGNTNGARPIAGVTVVGTTVYGTAAVGGPNGYGTVFKMNTDGTGFSVMKYFNYTDGALPSGEMLLSGGALYGVTAGGGSWGKGTIYKLYTNGAGSSLVFQFTNTSPGGPYGGLVLSGNTLYGANRTGGAAGYGTVYKVNTDGTGFAVLKTFSSTDGANPQGGLALAGNTLLGTTYNGGINNNGTVYTLNTDGSGFMLLRDLSVSDGTHPYGGVLVFGNTVFGAMQMGGAFGGGTIFSIDLDRTPPQITGQPQSRTNGVGTAAMLQVTAAPAGVSYRWRLNGSDLSNGGTITGAFSNTLTIANAQIGNSGSYSVVVTNNAGSVTSSVAVLTVIRPPVAGADNFVLPLGLSLTIPETQLLANDTDPNGLSLNISAVAATSDSGVGISRMPAGITYWGAFSGTTDRFTYTLSDSGGATATGTVTISLTGSLPATNELSLQPLPNGDFRAVYLGRLTFRYALDRTHSLAPPQTWEPQMTNFAGQRGYTWFTNTPSPGTNDFYRIRWVQ